MTSNGFFYLGEILLIFQPELATQACSLKLFVDLLLQLDDHITVMAWLAKKNRSGKRLTAVMICVCCLPLCLCAFALCGGLHPLCYDLCSCDSPAQSRNCAPDYSTDTSHHHWKMEQSNVRQRRGFYKGMCYSSAWAPCVGKQFQKQVLTIQSR